MFDLQDAIGKCVRGVPGQYRHLALKDDRAGVELGVHEMNGGATDRRAIVERLERGDRGLGLELAELVTGQRGVDPVAKQVEQLRAIFRIGPLERLAHQRFDIVLKNWRQPGEPIRQSSSATGAREGIRPVQKRIGRRGRVGVVMVVGRGRDGRDVVWSLHNHHLNGNEAYYDVLNNSPGLVGPPMERCDPDIHRYWQTWFERDGHPHWSLWDNVRSWWAIRDLPNVKLIHFNDLKRDMRRQMAEIAAFLAIEVDPDDWDEIALYCSFDWMRAHGDKAVPLGGAMWEGGASTFINKGVNGRWQSILSDAESAAYEERAKAELGGECARWLASGERV